MSNKIFETILQRKIETFVSTFVEDSKSIFFNGTQLIHPGEFGRYRENSIKDLLQTLTRLKVSDGFIITSKDNISTQCDIVIYDNTDFPVLENNLTQFFSIESVVSIGEVKSSLTKAKFRDALVKLAENKKLVEDIQSDRFIKKPDEYNYPISFLICKDLKFSLNKIDFDEIYQDIPREYWHNQILIIDQGLFTYEFDFLNFSKELKEHLISKKFDIKSRRISETPITYMEGKMNCKPVFIKLNKEKKYNHIKRFIVTFSQGISRKIMFTTEILFYLENYKSVFKEE
jgi:hypothetical protein